jgi:uncharacterized protein YerC
MDIHKNARLTPLGRERMVNMVLGGQTQKAVSEAAGICPRTVRNGSIVSKRTGWRAFRTAARALAGHAGRRPSPVVERIEALRRRRLPGKAIAAETGVSAATVSRVLKRLGLTV